MTERGRDRIAGGILLAFAVLWTWVSVTTIPDVGAGPVGPGGFPLGLGVLLAALSLLLIALSFRKGRPEQGESEAGEVTLPTEIWAVGSSLAILLGYAALLYAAGFLIATAVIVAAALVLVLDKRNPILVGGLAIGSALCVYIVFNKILGVYLPHGRWVDFWF